MYLDRRITRLRIGGVPQEIEPELLATTVLTDAKEEFNIVQATQIQQLNCWKYGLELFFKITNKDLGNLPETIKPPEEKRLNVIVEGRPLTCFGCRKKGHIRKRCRLARSRGRK